MLRILELYCGLGGVAAAAQPAPEMDVVAAHDISPHVLQAYRHNFEHPARQTDLSSVDRESLGTLLGRWAALPPEARDRAGRIAREYVCREYTWDRTVGAVERRYESLSRVGGRGERKV